MLMGRRPKHVAPYVLPPKQLLTSFYFAKNLPAPYATSKSPFFRLPRELRDQVYGHLWRNTSIRARDGALEFELAYDERVPAAHRDGELQLRDILACKLLLQEFLQQLYSKAVCVKYEKCAFGDGLPSSPYRLLSLARLRKTHIQASGGNLSDEYPLDFDQNHCDWWYDPFTNESWFKPNKTNPVVIPVWTGESDFYTTNIEHLCRYLQTYRESHSVKEIAMRFQLPEALRYQALSEAKELTIDLSNLERLGTGFEKVDFAIAMPTIIRRGRVQRDQLVRNWAIIYRALQLALEGLANRLICIRSKSQTDIDWSVKDRFELTKVDVNGFTVDQPIWHIEVRKAETGTAKREVTFDGMRFVAEENRLFERIEGNGHISNGWRAWQAPDGGRIAIRISDEEDGISTSGFASCVTYSI